MIFLKKYDEWNWERLSRHIAYWLLWSVFLITVNSLIGNAIKFVGGNSVLWQWIAFEAVVLPVKIGAAYTIAYFLMPRFLYKEQYLAFLICGVLTLLFFSVLLYIIYAHFVHPIIFLDSEYYTIEQFAYKGIQLIYITALVVSIKFFQNYLYEQQRNQALVQQKIEAELKYLRNQIQPHFLFNTLNNIYGMVLSNDKNAGETIVKLSNLLSFMLYEGNTKTVTLSQEIKMLESYVELELMRYQQKLDFNFSKSNIEPHLKIAPLLLIPFIENAFKHGPANDEQPSFINLSMEVQQNILHFQIKNSYNANIQISCDTIQSGIGLENIRKRLSLLYPNKHTLEISEDNAFEVSLMIELAN
ncbi:MAG: sensor histidine kinase [Bacteroidota bacterium]